MQNFVKIESETPQIIGDQHSLCIYILIDMLQMSVSRVSISVVYRPISTKSGMKMGLRTLTTEKILRSSYLDDRCQGNEKIVQSLMTILSHFGFIIFLGDP